MSLYFELDALAPTSFGCHLEVEKIKKEAAKLDDDAAYEASRFRRCLSLLSVFMWPIFLVASLFTRLFQIFDEQRETPLFVLSCEDIVDRCA